MKIKLFLFVTSFLTLVIIRLLFEILPIVIPPSISISFYRAMGTGLGNVGIIILQMIISVTIALVFSKHLTESFNNESTPSKFSRNFAFFLVMFLILTYLFNGLVSLIIYIMTTPDAGLETLAVPTAVPIGPTISSFVVAFIFLLILKITNNLKGFLFGIMLVPIFLGIIYLLTPFFSPLGNCAPRGSQGKCIIEKALTENNSQLCDFSIQPDYCKNQLLKKNKVEINYKPLSFFDYEGPGTWSSEEPGSIIDVLYKKNSGENTFKSPHYYILNYTIFDLGISGNVGNYGDAEKIVKKHKEKYIKEYEKINICGKEAYFGFNGRTTGKYEILGELIYFPGTYYHKIESRNQINTQFFPDYERINYDEIKNKVKNDAIEIAKLYCETYGK